MLQDFEAVQLSVWNLVSSAIPYILSASEALCRLYIVLFSFETERSHRRPCSVNINPEVS